MPSLPAAIADPDVMGWFKFYKILLKKAQLQVVRAVRVFANSGAAPVLMHCIHGKDRTGLVAMLLLQLCDVPASSIVNDYKESELVLRESRENHQLISLPGASPRAGVGLGRALADETGDGLARDSCPAVPTATRSLGRGRGRASVPAPPTPPRGPRPCDPQPLQPPAKPRAQST